MERANLVKAISNVAELEKKIGAGQVNTVFLCGVGVLVKFHFQFHRVKDDLLRNRSKIFDVN